MEWGVPWFFFGEVGVKSRGKWQNGGGIEEKLG